MPCRVNSKAAFFILKEGAKHVEDGGKLITIVTALLAAFTGFYTSYVVAALALTMCVLQTADVAQVRRFQGPC